MRRQRITIALMFGIPALLWYRGHTLPEPAVFAEGTWYGERDVRVQSVTEGGETFTRIVTPPDGRPTHVAWLMLTAPVDVSQYVGLAVRWDGAWIEPIISDGIGAKSDSVGLFVSTEGDPPMPGHEATRGWQTWLAPWAHFDGLAIQARPSVRRIGLRIYGSGNARSGGSVDVGIVEFVPRSQVAPSLELLSPDEWETIHQRPTLRWKPVSGVRAYQVECQTGYDSTTFHSPVRTRRTCFVPKEGHASRWSWSVTTIGGYRFPAAAWRSFDWKEDPSPE